MEKEAISDNPALDYLYGKRSVTDLQDRLDCYATGNPRVDIFIICYRDFYNQWNLRDRTYKLLSDNDGWSGSQDEYEENGPRTFLPDPDDPQGAIFNPSIMEYFQSKFTMGSDTWTRGSTDIHDMYFTASGSRNSSGELFAVIHPGSGSNTHAVILESYSNGAYSYYDAQNNCHSSIPANRIIVAGEITGSRK